MIDGCNKDKKEFSPEDKIQVRVSLDHPLDFEDSKGSIIKYIMNKYNKDFKINKCHKLPVEELTQEQLEETLLTLDGQGKSRKQECLKEVKKRLNEKKKT
jgi:hypothetical protein